MNFDDNRLQNNNNNVLTPLHFFLFAGGTRRVVLQLPNGTFMVTEVDEEQFKALNMQG